MTKENATASTLIAPVERSAKRAEPLLISMEELGRVLGSGKTTCFKLVGTGEIESVQIGRKRLPVWDSVQAYVASLREQAKTRLEAA